MVVGDFDKNDIDYIDEEYSPVVIDYIEEEYLEENSEVAGAGAIAQGVGAVAQGVGSAVSSSQANKTEYERNMKAQCGRRPIFKKNRPKWQECIDKANAQVRLFEANQVQMQKSTLASQNQLNTQMLEQQNKDREAKQRTNRLILAGTLGGVAILGTFMILLRK